jgi:hypothetical protein
VTSKVTAGLAKTFCSKHPDFANVNTCTNCVVLDYNHYRTVERLIMPLLDVALPAAPFEVGVWPDFSDRAIREELTPAAVKAMTRLVARWELTVGDIGLLLGGVSASTWYSWQRQSPSALNSDQLTRVSLLLGIYTSLHVLHRGALADEWVGRPNLNPLFHGRTPLQAMPYGGIPSMLQVRALLDGRRGGL